MLLRGLCIFLTVTIALAQNAGKEKASVLTARCRAHCLNKFIVDGLNVTCFGNPDCFMCWDTCHMFYMNFNVWGPMCYNKHLCFPGCQESCNFYHSQSDANGGATSTPDHFTEPLTYRHRPESDIIQVEWSRPVTTINGPDEPLVYVLTLQDRLSGHSKEIVQTLYQNATVRRSLLKSSTLIQLAAYSFSGKVAQLEKHSSELQIGVNSNSEGIEEIPLDEGSKDDEDSSFDNVKHASWSPSLISLQYSIKDLNGVMARVTWPHMPHVDQVKYEVKWSRLEHETDVTTSMTTQNNVVTFTVWPENVYHVYVRVFVNDARRPITKSKTLTIDTSSNNSPDDDFECPRMVYNVALTFVVVFGIASAVAIFISVSLRKVRSKPV